MSVELTPEVLDGIEARAKKATPGPWWADPRLNNVIFAGTGSGADVAIIEDFYNAKDAEHIAGLDPDTVLALVAAARERDELKKQREQDREANAAIVAAWSSQTARIRKERDEAVAKLRTVSDKEAPWLFN